jgi:hypothetical protein
MQIPQKTRENLIELAKTINELQVRHTLILETLVQAAGMEGKYQVEGQYTSLVQVPEEPMEHAM